MVTMRQIAKRAGVSIGTVSHVVNGTARVRDPLRRRVEVAIEQLGYQPSVLARSLRRNQSPMLGVVIPDITNPFFPAVVRGIEDVAYAHGTQLVLCNADNDHRKERAYLDQLHSIRVAGMIVIPSAASELPAFAAQLRDAVPLVCLDRPLAGWSGDYVGVDNEGGAFLITRHLVQLGHRRLAMISGPLTIRNAQERLAGFTRALQAAALPEPAVELAGFDRPSGLEAARRLMQLTPRPDAIFAANDLLAVGALAALRELGLRCPEDVAVVGFDDLELAAFTHPPLTTVAQPGYELGRCAAEALFNRLQHPESPARIVVLETALKVRSSCGAALAVAPGV